METVWPGADSTQDGQRWSRDASAGNISGPTSPSKEGLPSFVPSLSLPKSGGAIRSIGDKFQANPVLGNGSTSVPIFTSPGRSGFGPKLSLEYDTGSGNGPFGFGWHIPLPHVSRRTDKGLPRYRDAEDSDTFVLSGSEDLVPVLIEIEPTVWSEKPVPNRTVGGAQFSIRRYRPRIERDFAHIERWTNTSTGETHWRSITGDNVTTVYGWDRTSRIHGPDDKKEEYIFKVFTWLPSEMYDDKGNAMLFKYVQEDSSVELDRVNEQNRSIESRAVNRYLKRILYGNTLPQGPKELFEDGIETDWMFEVVLDYGEHDLDRPLPNDNLNGGAWNTREDPFSSYKSGFEIRTYRLCRRILMFHHFENEDTKRDCLIRSTDISYRGEDDTSSQSLMSRRMAAFISSVIQRGYVREGDGYHQESFPKVEFEYSTVQLNPEVHFLDSMSLENVPEGLSGAKYRWVDFDGDGLCGVFTEQGGEWFYKPNNGNGSLSPLQRRVDKPSFSTLSNTEIRNLMDVSGDGKLDLVQYSPTPGGFFKRSGSDAWDSYTAFPALPNIRWEDPNTTFADLTGDGLADILLTENERLTWYHSRGEEGYFAAENILRSLDEESGPQLVLSDPTGSVFLADMSGDGLSDLVYIKQGEVFYYPNLGYCRFGPKVCMDDAPDFEDDACDFQPRNIRLADIDGSGTTDILYISEKGFQIYFNLAGNSWTTASTLLSPPRHQLISVDLIDLLGNGTCCLVWSSPLPGDVGSQMRYIDLMGGVKPHLLVSMRNNMGSETSISYAASTKFYLEDKRDGHPWLTKVPFPVHVVEKVSTVDRITGNKFSTRYNYHHGYFDPHEREFQGFGMVEQWDTEAIEVLDLITGAVERESSVEETANLPPVLTCTWFHTGSYDESQGLSAAYEQDYYRESNLSDLEIAELRLEDTILPNRIRSGNTWKSYNLKPSETREACRSLKGSPLRQEVYTPDGNLNEKLGDPYLTIEMNYTLEIVQPEGGQESHPVFIVSDREKLTFHYDACPVNADGTKSPDPRVTHSLTLATNEYGQRTSSVTIGYGRRKDRAQAARSGTVLTDADIEKQTKRHVVASQIVYTNPITEDSGRDFRLPVRCESKTYEVLNLSPQKQFFTFDEIRNGLESIPDVPAEDWNTATVTPSRRLMDHSRVLYRKDSLEDHLPFGEQQSLGLRYDDYRLAFTDALLRTTIVEDGKMDEASIQNAMKEGGYTRLQDQDGWWTPSGRTYFSSDARLNPTQELQEAREHFFLTRQFQSPFDPDDSSHTTFRYDKYSLLLEEVTGSTGNQVTVGIRNVDGTLNRHGHDYRTLQPALIMDPNRNQSEVRFDARGLVVGTATMGKPLLDNAEGDDFDGFVELLEDAEVDAFFDDPLSNGANLLRHASSRMIYDLDAYSKTAHLPQSRPVRVATLVRENHHHASIAAGDSTRTQFSIAYSDGFGREIQHKTRAERGKAPKRDAQGNLIVENGLLVLTEEDIETRWCASGWTIFNNKGNAVKQFEPFFSDSHEYDSDVRIGHSPTFFYDPLQRLVATLNADHSWTKTVFGPWKSESWDENDTTDINDLTSDKDVGKYFSRLERLRGLSTWYTQRIDNNLGPLKQRAARLAHEHANTPNVAHFDSLGRDMVSIKHNRNDGADEFLATRTILDVSGNQRQILDQALDKNDQLGDRLVERCNFDLLGNRIHQESMEAGQRWMLRDIAGNALYTWDNSGRLLRNQYDELRRPTKSWLKPDTASHEILIEETMYGDANPTETAASPSTESQNLRGMVVRIRDQAGEVQFREYDFKGNALTTQRRYADEYRKTIDWQEFTALGSPFVSSMVYDALSRVTQLTLPGGNIITNEFNDASLLEKVTTAIPGVGTREILSSADYDAKGQRLSVQHGNGVKIEYQYDALTSALESVVTRRDTANFPNDCPQPPPSGWPGCQIQSLSYILDAVGNVTHVVDNAQQTLFFDNVRIEPSNTYEYDALYRLVKAEGREHLGQAAQNNIPSPFNISQPPLQDPRNGNALGRYTELYQYDRAGNFLGLKHDGSTPGTSWVRNMSYRDPSMLESEKFFSNHLVSTSSGSGLSEEKYTYDQLGNSATMPHLSIVKWDHKNQLRATSKMIVNDGTPETTWYVYDGKGQRVRKITDRASVGSDEPKKKQERFYLGLYELYQEYDNQEQTVLQRDTVHLNDTNQRIALAEVLRSLDESPPIALLRYQYSNHLNSSTLELDDVGNKISYEEYYPFGSTSYFTTTTTNISKRYRFTAKERDEESGFYYFGARYFMPWAGRWINCDPGGLGDGLNLYAYARCNPITLVDPNGKDAMKWLRRGVGVLQLAGGAMEVAAGVGGVLTANPLGVGLGVLAVGHGLDSLAAGYRTLRDDNISSTYTQQGATAAARAAGASPETAEKVGAGVDFVAGVAPSVGVSIVKATVKTAATEGASQALQHSAPTAAAHSTSTAVAPKAVAATTEVLSHTAPEAAPHALTHTAEQAAPKVAEKIGESTAPQAAESALEHGGAQAVAQTAEHAAPEAAAQVSTKAAQPVLSQAPAKVVTVMTENQLRKLVFSTARAAITKQRDVLRQVIKDKNIAYLNRLGITNPKTIAALLAGPSNRRYAMIFGNVLERMVARSFRSNPLLNQHIRWIANLRGFAPAGRRPDFIIQIGNLTLFADLTTVRDMARHLAREAASKPLIWTYVR